MTANPGSDWPGSDWPGSDWGTGHVSAGDLEVRPGLSVLGDLPQRVTELTGTGVVGSQ